MLTAVIDAAAVEGAEGDTPTKKTTSTKRKKKATSDAGSEGDETLVKEEAEDNADEGA